MLMFTLEGYEAQIELTRIIERNRIAEMLRQRADAHPKWEMHDFLKSLANEIDDTENRAKQLQQEIDDVGKRN